MILMINVLKTKPVRPSGHGSSTLNHSNRGGTAIGLLK